MTVKSGKNKRMSILNRRHQKNGSNEKNQITEGGDNAGDASTAAEGDIAQLEEEEEKDDRTLWFNLPLPDEQKDEEGHPLRIYARNKIRTAKYTPLSFIPKNLWFQFHNVANIFFLFIVILVVSPIRKQYPNTTANRVLVLPYLWWDRPRSQLSASYCHRRRHCGQGCI
jgi:phospholipid-translocating ATPase